MAKILILNDLHYGYKNDSPVFVEYFNRFFKDVFFPYADAAGIKHCIVAGDLMDRRKYVNYDTLRHVRENLIKPLQSRGIETHILVGNHDCYYKSTNSVNCITELYGQYPCIRSYQKPEDVSIDGVSLGIVPWISPEDTEDFDTFLRESKSSVLFGHFEIVGFEMLRGVTCEEGLDNSIFDRFKQVYSGHFHQQSQYGNIKYLGTQYDMNFSDIDEAKGFHVYDTETEQMEFVKNPLKLFFRLTYDDTVGKPILPPDFSPYSNCYVKLIVKSKKNPKFFEKYLSALYNSNPAEVNIIDETDILAGTEDDLASIDITQDTLAIINKEVDDNKAIANPMKLKKVLNDLYIDSFSIE